MSSNYKYTVTLTTCGDCGVLPGYPHANGCDVARCPQCGIQQLQCFEHADDSVPAIWTGIWPGELECAEYGLWSKWVDKDGNKIQFGDFTKQGTWVSTTADDPDRQPDLNTLGVMVAKSELVWHIVWQRYVKASLPVAKDACTACKRPFEIALKPKRVCGNCKQQVLKHHKWRFDTNQHGTFVVHRHCDRPYDYV